MMSENLQNISGFVTFMIVLKFFMLRHVLFSAIIRESQIMGAQFSVLYKDF
jgi:hypothetical protein